MAVTWGAYTQGLNIDYGELRAQRDLRREQIKSAKIENRQQEIRANQMDLQLAQMNKEFDDMLDAQFIKELQAAAYQAKHYGKADGFLSLLAPVPTNEDGTYKYRISPLRHKLFGNSSFTLDRYKEFLAKQASTGNPNVLPQELDEQLGMAIETYTLLNPEEKQKMADEYRAYKGQNVQAQQANPAQQTQLGPQAQQANPAQQTQLGPQEQQANPAQQANPNTKPRQEDRTETWYLNIDRSSTRTSRYSHAQNMYNHIYPEDPIH